MHGFAAGRNTDQSTNFPVDAKASVPLIPISLSKPLADAVHSNVCGVLLFILGVYV